MNKTYLIAGGASAVSLAAGAVGGYFVAKKKFEETLDARIDAEVQATRKHYAVLMTNAQYGQKPPLEDIVADYAGTEVTHVNANSAFPDDVVLDEDQPLKLEEDLEEPADKALTNYQGFAKTDPPTDVVESNIFTNPSPKKVLPPREPGTGKFLPKDRVDALKNTSNPAPYLIDEETFLTNDPEHNQESVKYFVNEDTAVLEANYEEVIENEILGREFLDRMAKDGNLGVMYVRHDILELDYQVTRTTESLVEAIGMGESEKDMSSDNHESAWV